MTKLEVHETLEENVAYGVGENITPYRKESSVFCRDTSLKAGAGNLGTQPSQILEKDRKTPILCRRPLLVRGAETKL